MGQRILIMDDDELSRGLITQRMAEYLGYEVAPTEEGATALNLYCEALTKENSFTAVILDLTVIGGMGGRETAQKILKEDPNAKVIIASGFADQAAREELFGLGVGAVIGKPFTVKELQGALKDDAA